jgi:hypothetical protein
MKYLKRFNESISSIDSICSRYKITNYTINSDGTIDVHGDVDLSGKNLTRFPLKFRTVSGSFWCNVNQITTLEGCPRQVGGGFWCSRNKLTIINWNDVYTLNPINASFENNPIFEVYKIFKEFKIFRDSLEWNYFKEPNIIIIKKFVEACEILSEETGKNITIPEKIEGYIFE